MPSARLARRRLKRPAPGVLPARRIRPALKWAGGKRWQTPHLVRLWQPHSHRRLVEPFCGGLAVALALRPSTALLNDVNPHLINFYECVKAGLRIDFDLENDEALFYRYRDRFNALLASGQARTPEAAALFYYLNRTGYNGLCRFNRSGAFNVPFGRYARIRYERDFSVLQQAVAGWTFTCADVEEVAVDRDDFVYADPPYDVEFTQYSNGRFAWDDQERTAVWVSRHAGPSVLVNQATARIVRLYRQLGFRLFFVEGPRRISCTGDRTPAREVIAIRNVEA
jgi:DNA adenine methylase